MASTSSVPSTSIRGDGLPGHLPIMPGARVHASAPKQTTKRVPKPALDLGAATEGKSQAVPKKKRNSLAANPSKRQTAPATQVGDSMWDLDPTSPKRPTWAEATLSSAEKVGQRMNGNSGTGKLGKLKRQSPFKRPVKTAKATTMAVASARQEKVNASKAHTAKIINSPDLRVKAYVDGPSTERNHKTGLARTQRARNSGHSLEDPEILSSDAPSSFTSEVSETDDYLDQRGELASTPVLEPLRPTNLTNGLQRPTESWIQGSQRARHTDADRKELSPVIEDMVQSILVDDAASPTEDRPASTTPETLPTIPKVRVTPPSHDRARDASSSE
jgi:hypothetical protein